MERRIGSSGEEYEFAWTLWHIDWKNPSTRCALARSTAKITHSQPGTTGKSPRHTPNWERARSPERFGFAVNPSGVIRSLLIAGAIINFLRLGPSHGLLRNNLVVVSAAVFQVLAWLWNAASAWPASSHQGFKSHGMTPQKNRWGQLLAKIRSPETPC
jgi:hypothetical protein